MPNFDDVNDVAGRDHSSSDSSSIVQFNKLTYYSKFSIFPTQKLAFEDHDLLAQEYDRKIERIKSVDENVTIFSPKVYLEPRLFAIEYNAAGKRRYISSHIGRFLKYYWQDCDPSARHVYELIRENTPCRLYFDVEFQKSANLDITSQIEEMLIAEMIEELSTEFKNVFDISLTRNNILDLESSTKEKFSRHLIVHLPDEKLFKDNIACGTFVRTFVSRLVEEITTDSGSLISNRPTLAKYLFVNKKSNTIPKDYDIRNLKEKVCIIDLGVYTRNRIFRLFGSSKYGKDIKSALRIATSNCFPVSECVQNHDLTCTDDIELMGMLGSFLMDTLVVPIQSKRIQTNILPDIGRLDKISGQLISSDVSVGNRLRKQYSIQIGPSPFPRLDDFVESRLAKRKGLNGKIRSWSQDGSDLSRSIFTYQIKDNRWCENIQRAHKTNNIMWHVSISEMKYWQSCHDPDCRMASFRGKLNPLPEQLQHEIRDALIEKEIVADESFVHALLALRLTPAKDRDAIDKCEDTDDDVAKYYCDSTNEDFIASLMALSLSPKPSERGYQK